MESLLRPIQASDPQPGDKVAQVVKHRVSGHMDKRDLRDQPMQLKKAHPRCRYTSKESAKTTALQGRSPTISGK